MNQAQLEAAYKLAVHPTVYLANEFLNKIIPSEGDIDTWIENHINGCANNKDADIIYYECAEAMSNEVKIMMEDSLRKL